LILSSSLHGNERKNITGVYNSHIGMHLIGKSSKYIKQKSTILHRKIKNTLVSGEP
jgi:hypothetical protein